MEANLAAKWKDENSTGEWNSIEKRGEWENISSPIFTNLMNEFDEELVKASKKLADELRKRGVPAISSVTFLYLAEGIKERLTMLQESQMGMMFADGITKTTLCRIMGIKPQTFNTKYKNAARLARAQDAADATGERQEVNLNYGITRQVNPVPRPTDGENEERGEEEQ